MTLSQKFWTCGELARVMGVDRRTVHRWCRTGRIAAAPRPAKQCHYRIADETVQRLLHGSRG